MKKVFYIIAQFCCVLLIFLLYACNTSQNTPNSRAWKAFHTKYNIYFNGHQSYLDGLAEKRNRVSDNYATIIPLLIAGNESAKSIGSDKFENAITKCEKAIQLHSMHKKPIFKKGKKLKPKDKALKERTEFNPFLWKAWILMGLSQLQKGDFIEGASTFAYTARIYRTQPEILNQARALQAVCYVELGWYYDAEDLLDKVRRDGIPKQASRYYNMAMADLYLHQKEWKNAIPFLEKEVKQMHHGVEKARGNFLLAQVYKEIGMKKEAYKSFNKVMKQNPPYEMRFNAQIAQAEVMPSGTRSRKISKLKALARNSNNKKFLDQVYFAIGNVYLAEPDTAKAIQAYEFGNTQATKSSVTRGLLMATLGNIYWDLERFSDAQRCYKEAVGMIKFEYEKLSSIRLRHEVLGSLAPHTDEIFLQDSLQYLARCSETERNAAIDRMIAIEKQRQKEAEKLRADSIREARQSKANSSPINRKTENELPENNIVANASGQWYFYDQVIVDQGIGQFKKQWGKRENADMWRLSSVKLNAPSNAVADSLKRVNDSITADEHSRSKKKKKLSLDDPTNPLSRAYYMQNIPFSDDAMKESNEKLKMALYQAGMIELDQLANYPLARKTLMRLYNTFPDFSSREYLMYKIFLMELRWNSHEEAEKWKNLLIQEYPDGQFTKIVADPYFEEKARYGKQVEDSIYTLAYKAYKENQYEALDEYCAISDGRYPEGANRGKFLFLEAMSALRKGNIKEFTTCLDSAQIHKDEPVSGIAEKILEGIKKGLKPIGGDYSLDDLWQSRKSIMGNTMLKEVDTLSNNRQEPFTFILSYSPDSVNEGKLLYDVSRFNFTTFAIRNFDVSFIKEAGKHQLHVKTFANFDEIHLYTKMLLEDSVFKEYKHIVQPIVISDSNLELIGLRYSWEQYLQFYAKYFIPLRIQKDLKLDLDVDPGKFIWDEFEEVKKPVEETELEDDSPIDDNAEWY